MRRLAALLGALAVLAPTVAPADPAQRPLIGWILAAPDSGADSTADLRARADQAIRQLRAARPPDGDDRTGGPSPELASLADGLFGRGAAALSSDATARHSPAALEAAMRQAERAIQTRRLAADLRRSLSERGRTLASATPAERAAIVRRLPGGEDVDEARSAEIVDAARAMDTKPDAEVRGAIDEAERAVATIERDIGRQEAVVADGLSKSAEAMATAGPDAAPAAKEAIESALGEARKITPELLKTVEALERLGVVREDQAELKVAIARFDGALAMVEGGLAVAAGNPAGLFQVIQGLADLVAPEGAKEADKKPDPTARLDARVGEANRRLARIRTTVERLRLDMALAFERQQREIERLRQELTTLVSNAAFQDFESCVLVEDVLRSGARLQVAAVPGEVALRIGGDWPKRLRALRGEPEAAAGRPPALLQDCVRSMLRLFGTDQAASVSKPFLVPEAAATDARASLARRHDLLVRVLLAEMTGTGGRSISPHGLLDYVEAARWVDRPMEAAWLWRRAVTGRHVGTPAAAHPVDQKRLPQRQRVDADRLQAVARIVLYLAPLLWDERIGSGVAGADGKAVGNVRDHPGERVLTHLAALLDRALLDAAVADGLASVPPALALYRRLADTHLRRHDEAAAARKALAAAENGSRAALEATLAERDKALDGARHALLEFEAVIAGAPGMAESVAAFAIHRAALPEIDRAAPMPGLARARLVDAADVRFAGEAIARGSRRWIDPDGRARDAYREIVGRTEFAWQLDHPRAHDALYDPAGCRVRDGSSDAPWIAASVFRDELRALCTRLSERGTAESGATRAWFAGKPVEVPRLDATPPAPQGERIRSLRRLAREARTILLLARASVIDDGTGRPIVIAGR